MYTHFLFSTELCFLFDNVMRAILDIVLKTLLKWISLVLVKKCPVFTSCQKWIRLTGFSKT